VQTPTPAELRLASDLIAAKLPPSGPNDEKLELRAESAAALVASITFRLIDPVTEATVEGYSFEEVPPSLRNLALRAIALMVERELVTGEPAFAEQVATGRRLRGFTAGPYSESYFAPGEFARRGAQQGRPPMDPDEQLDAALWALATEDARDYFIAYASGLHLPGAAVSAFDYRRVAVGDSPGGLTGRNGLAGGFGGPDGF
jgi:hypothetical protein